MPNNYVLLEKITVGAAGAASVTFANIPQTGYTDLVIKFSARSSQTGTDNSQANLTFNGSSTGYSDKLLYGRGSSAASASSATSYITWAGIIPAASATSSTFSNSEIYIPNYAGSTNKSLSSDNVEENNSATDNFLTMLAGLWSNTAPIASATLTCNGGSFVQGSTFYLYGVAKLGTTPAIAPKATGGDIIDTDGIYWYHTFLSSGTFTPAVALTTDYLVVAGGGSGGPSGSSSAGGGGGGAGGYRTGSSLSFAATSYAVTIGAGGAGPTGDVPGVSGNNSTISSITAAGGGAGGGYDGANYQNGVAGGSGGGASGNTGLVGGAASPSGQGNAGGAGNTASLAYAAGGGGGAGAAGANGVANGTGGAGGNGTANSITGSSITYAGGGGGGTRSGTGGAGGTGGGGAGGGTGANGTNGTGNLGGGGGGAGSQSGGGGRTAGSGGSGIVIIRYAVA